MSKIIKALVALMLCTAFTSSVHAEFRWKNPGADPYAPSREEAMKTRESAFLKLGFPTEVTALLMEATKVPGKKVKLEMGSRLAAMLSKGGAVHKDVVIDWKAPIRGTELVAPAEMWQITHEGKIYTVFLFEVCNNWSSVIASAPTVSLLTATSTCPNGRTLKANAWSLKALPEELRKKAEGHIAAANSRGASPDAYKADAVSRTLGGQLRREAKVRMPITADIRVVFRDPKTAAVVQDGSILRLADGVGSMTISGGQLGMIIETIWPKEFVSPTVSGDAHRLWFFPEEWKNYCAMNIHGLVP